MTKGTLYSSRHCCEITLRDACIAYHQEKPGVIKVHVIQTNHSHHPSGWAPVGFPGTFVEGEMKPLRGTHRDDVNKDDRALLAPMGRTWYQGRT
eukprot:5578724-Prymnesium_polylepis.1